MTIEHCINSLKKKGLYFCLQEASKYIFPIRWVSDKGIMDALYQKRAYNYLKRKYIPLLKDFVPAQYPSASYSQPIWILWLQGEENAPEIVRKCIESVRDNAGERDVRIVTWENLNSYIDIPDYIKESLMKHHMQYAQFSDYVRLALLSRWGGIWVDATVMLTGCIPEEISSSPLFLYRSSVDNNVPIRISSWFIVSEQGNPMIQKMKYLFECYWKRENRLKDYFIFHIFFSCLVDEDPECREIWNNMHFADNLSPHRLLSILFEPFSEKIFNDICSGSNIHKLTYKFKQDSLTERKGTYYGFMTGRSL